MLIEVLKPVTVDNKVVIESFRLNILHAQRQARCKIQFPDGSKPGSVDLVVYQYSMPRIDGLTTSMSFQGVEMVTAKSFEAKVGFDIIKHLWKLKGKFDNKTLNFECKEPLEMISKITHIISGN